LDYLVEAIGVMKFVVYKRAMNRLKEEAHARMAPQISARIRRSLVAMAHEEIDEARNDFETHPVTKELDAGPDSPNISGTTQGYGNLFAYFGFYSGDKPTETVRKYLDLPPVVDIRVSPQRFRYTYTVKWFD
jgi:hypothetical protein